MTAILSVRGVRKRLGDRDVLRGVELTWPGPGTLRLRGANGSGKSTFVRCAVGVWRPDAGSILVAGRSVHGDPRARADVGYAPDVFAPFPDLSVAEMLGLVASLKRTRPPDAATLERTGVAWFLSQAMSTLSTGQRRRASLVAAMLGDPRLLTLDEPTNGLDPEGIALVGDLLRERADGGKANLLITHDASFASSVGAETIDLRDGLIA